MRSSVSCCQYLVKRLTGDLGCARLSDMIVELIDHEGKVPDEWARVYSAVRYEILAFTNISTDGTIIKAIREVEDDKVVYREDLDRPVLLQENDILTWRVR